MFNTGAELTMTGAELTSLKCRFDYVDLGAKMTRCRFDLLPAEALFNILGRFLFQSKIKCARNLNLFISEVNIVVKLVLLFCLILHACVKLNNIEWIEAFLGNRTQAVVLENQYSDKVDVNSGVPQGSVLDPYSF